MILKIVKLYNSKRYFLIDPEKDILIAAKQSLRECIDAFKLVYRGKLPPEHLDMIKKYGDYLKMFCLKRNIIQLMNSYMIIYKN